MRTKFILIYVVILVLTITGIAVANDIFLGRLYKREKKLSLIEAYKTIDRFYSDGGDGVEFELEKIYSTRDITIYIGDSDGNVIFTSSPNAEDMPPENFRRREFENGKPHPEPPEPRPNRRDWPFGSLEKNNIEEGKYILREQSDKRLGTLFVQLAAKLQNGFYLYMRTPMAAIEEAADTANKLLVWIGGAAMIIGVIIITLVTNRATRPIRQLTDIAKDMSELNFTRKYAGKSRDEVGELGASINILSKKLEETISQLKESNEKLEKDIELKNSIDKMRKEFIASASHELKTPIALISGYAEGLKDNIAGSPDDRNFYCDVIIDEAKVMDNIIKQFLTIAEIESMDLSENKEKVDLSAMAMNAVRSFDVLAKREGYGIGSNIQKGIVAEGDEIALSQAMNNYITNALHHVDENHVVEVSLEKRGNKIRFSVYNSGKQIPAESAEYIWESFGKLDKARTRAYGGTGLGLSIVKKGVELHGGVCGFNNTPDGVEFFFEI